MKHLISVVPKSGGLMMIYTMVPDIEEILFEIGNNFSYLLFY